jgi:hypothetical protein
MKDKINNPGLKNVQENANKPRKTLCSPAKGPEQWNSLNELYNINKMLLPEFGESWNRHRLVTLDVAAQSRILYYNDLYQKIIDVPGVICEFGVHWGATMAQLINFRSIYEPFNHSRHIFGFDTFEGFINVHDNDGELSKPGDLFTLSDYEEILDHTLSILETFPPLAHLKKFSLIKGDASETIDEWLINNPHAIISMAILDMDLYEPTFNVLKKIIPRLTRGSLLVFDELNCKFFPGETRAIDEVFGLNKLKLNRSRFQPYCSWAVYGE